jgi:hypothetical protein
LLLADIGQYESQHYKSLFDEERSKLVNRRNQTKLQWLQDESEANEDNLRNVTQDASRRIRKQEVLGRTNLATFPMAMVAIVTLAKDCM